MMVYLTLSLITLALSSVVMTLASTLSKKTIIDREKSSPYECGFDPKSSARLPFSLRFFFIDVILLNFDVEITLPLPIASILNYTNLFSYLSTTMLFLMILLLSLYYEWSQEALEWSK